MKFDPQRPLENTQARHHRRSIRLKEYDYSRAGAYFFTIVAWERQALFGEIADGEMRLNEIGEIVRNEWERTPDIRREVELGEYVVMPNHFHGIVVISSDTPTGVSDVGAHGRAPLRGIAHRQPKSLGSLIAGFKSAATKRINGLRGTPGVLVWQRNYYERIIRNDREMDNSTRYIASNPARWADDNENPNNMKP